MTRHDATAGPNGALARAREDAVPRSSPELASSHHPPAGDPTEVVESRQATGGDAPSPDPTKVVESCRLTPGDRPQTSRSVHPPGRCASTDTGQNRAESGSGDGASLPQTSMRARARTRQNPTEDDARMPGAREQKVTKGNAPPPGVVPPAVATTVASLTGPHTVSGDGAGEPTATAVAALARGPNARPHEVAARLAVSVATVHREIASGALPAFKVGRSVRIRWVDVDAYEARNRVAIAATFVAPTAISARPPRASGGGTRTSLGAGGSRSARRTTARPSAASATSSPSDLRAALGLRPRRLSP
jgi:excisionase family DNA binding protein